MKPQERTRAILRSALDHESKAVAVALADYMGEQEIAWPAVSTLIADTSLGERTIQRRLRAGIAAGWLRARAGGGRTTAYSIVWSALPARTPVRETPPSQGHPRQGDTPVRETPHPVRETPHPRQADTLRDHGRDHEGTRRGFTRTREATPERDPFDLTGAVDVLRAPEAPPSAPEPLPAPSVLPPPRIALVAPAERAETRPLPETLDELMPEAGMGLALALVRNQIETPADLLALTEAQLAHSRGIGHAIAKKVVRELAKGGWRLAREDAHPARPRGAPPADGAPPAPAPPPIPPGAPRQPHETMVTFDFRQRREISAGLRWPDGTLKEALHHG